MPIGPNGEPLPYPPDAMMAAPPPGLEVLAGPGGPAPEDTRTPEQVIRDMLELAAEYRAVETDDEDLLKVERVTTLLQELLANNVREADAALGGKLSPRVMRRISG